MLRAAIFLSLPAIAFAGSAFAQTKAPEVVEPGLISTAASEVKITISPDGTRMLFGTIGWGMGGTGWDIYESIKTDGKWGAPQQATFNSEANDFDPFFAPDGSGVYFFSNRLGGEGGDDLYFAPFDPAVGGYAYPINLGPEVNSAGNEWNPVVSFDGTTLLFSSNGRDGEGMHDLFVAYREGEQWIGARPLGAPVNGHNEDFDGAFVVDDDTIVFASGALGSHPNTKLFVTKRTGDGWSKPRQLGSAVNCQGEGLTLAPSVSVADPVNFYFTSNCRSGGPGRMDLYRLTVDDALILPD
jgi:Tol biopolymer transport system component